MNPVILFPTDREPFKQVAAQTALDVSRRKIIAALGSSRRPMCGRRTRPRRRSSSGGCARRACCRGRRARAGCCCRRRCRCWSWRTTGLHFKRAFIDAAVDDARIPWTALVIQWRRCKVWIAGIDGRAAGQ